MQSAPSIRKANNFPVKVRLLAGALSVAVLWVLQNISIRTDGSIGGIGNICPFRTLTGLPCPLCGMTRSLLCFFQGNWHDAWLWHPLGPFIGTATLILFLRWLLWGHNSQLALKMPQQLCGIVLIALLSGAWILRLAGILPLP